MPLILEVAPTVGEAVGTSERSCYCLKHIVEFRCLGWSERKIGAYFGVTGQAIHKRLKGLWAHLEPGELGAYRQHDSEVLRSLELRAAKGVSALLDNPKTWEKVGLRDAAVTLGVLVDKRRLLSGQSTANLSIAQIVEQLHRERPRPPDVVVEAEGTEKPLAKPQ